MVWIFSSEQKLTGGISFTMQFPMATVKKNALYSSANFAHSLTTDFEWYRVVKWNTYFEISFEIIHYGIDKDEYITKSSEFALKTYVL
jgi:hypothetical protein